MNTEAEKFSFPPLNIKTLCLYKEGEKILYGRRMIDHISVISTEYTMIVLDDFFLRKDVDEAKIDKIIDYMDGHSDVECVRLTPYQHRETYERCEPVEDFPGYYRVAKCAEYKLNFQVCIWRTKKLLDYWREDDDPWRWEVFANIITFNSSGFLVVSEEEGPVLDYGYKVNGQPLSDIYRGKWVMENDLVELFRDNNLDVDFSKRGFYKKEEEKQHFTNLSTVIYVVKRIGFKNTAILTKFVITNQIRGLLNLKHHKLSEYPIAFR